MKRINYGLSYLTVIAYLSVYIPADVLWFSGIISWSIFGFLILQIDFLIFWFLKKPRYIYIPLITLALGFQFIKATFNVEKPDNKLSVESFSVLSYNIRALNIFKKQSETDSNSKNIVKWIVNQKSDILFLQEYCKMTGEKTQLDIQKLLKKKKYYAHIVLNKYNKSGQHFGLAIFSRYKIIDKGFITYDTTRNGFLYADILIKKDTIRFFNAHLKSWGKVFNTDDKNKELITHIKQVFLKHNKQVKVLVNHVLNSPYQVILGGDFNEIPYSNLYLKLKKILENAFERKGKGFGFTYTQNLLLLRIDHFFYSKSLTLKKFTTLNHITYSDHYPIRCDFSLD